MSPLSPPATRPGVWLKVSQIDRPRPPTSTAPSIWYAAVATPSSKPRGSSIPPTGSGVPTKSIVCCPMSFRPPSSYRGSSPTRLSSTFHSQLVIPSSSYPGHQLQNRDAVWRELDLLDRIATTERDEPA